MCMLKIGLVLLILLCQTVSAAEPVLDHCTQKNSEYLFSYKINKGVFADTLDYSVKSLNNQPLYFYQRNRFDYPSEVTLKLPNEKLIIWTTTKRRTDIKLDFEPDYSPQIRYSRF